MIQRCRKMNHRMKGIGKHVVILTSFCSVFYFLYKKKIEFIYQRKHSKNDDDDDDDDDDDVGDDDGVNIKHSLSTSYLLDNTKYDDQLVYYITSSTMMNDKKYPKSDNLVKKMEQELFIDRYTFSMIHHLFNKISQGNNSISFDQFLHFHQKYQQKKKLISEDTKDLNLLESKNVIISNQVQDQHDEDVNSLFKKFCDNQNVMNLDQFIRFMFSSDNNAQEPPRVTHPMNHPLSHYLIASSHNTYLLGNQIYSESSTDAYKNALLNSCRCIEIDVWDGKHGEPIVTHGNTLTSKIQFRKVLETIKKYAFTTTKYPLIISLEVHCSIAQQEKMAKYLNEIFGDMILQKNEQTKHSDELPSPEEFKERILLQGEIAKKKVNTVCEYDMIFDTFRIDTYCNKDADSMNNNQTDIVGQWSTKLYDLINLKAVPYEELELKLTQAGSSTEMLANYHFNLSENSAIRKMKRNPSMFEQYHERFLTRVYPKGTRIFSSNFNPIIYWSMGCQLVSLNYQLNDLGMRIERGRFSENGKTGYVLKPQFLSLHDESFVHHHNKRMRVSVLSFTPSLIALNESSFPHSKGVHDYYCTIEISPSSNAGSSFTHSIDQFKFHCEQLVQQWKDEHPNLSNYIDSLASKFEFSIPGHSKQEEEEGRNDGSSIRVICFSLFKKNQRNPLFNIFSNENCVAFDSFPAHCVRPGYRVIHLADHQGKFYGSLLCHFYFDQNNAGKGRDSNNNGSQSDHDDDDNNDEEKLNDEEPGAMAEKWIAKDITKI